MTWYVSDLARFRAEREAVQALGLDTDWLVTVGWRIDDKIRLVLDAEILAGGRIYPIFVQYPNLFPHTPPSIFPRGDSSRWSFHQFGAGGELCLEYGPDNWTPDLTGVHLIESARRLLESENAQTGEEIPSRHFESLGQRMRLRRSRLVLTRNMEAFLPVIPSRVPITGNVVAIHHEECVVHVVDKIYLANGTSWTDPSVPTQLGEEYFDRPVTIYRVETGTTLPPTTSTQHFREACITLGLNSEHKYVILLQGTDVYPRYLWEKENRIIEIAVVPAQIETQRLDTSRELLRANRVALIGCGSLGSKLGVILARSGVGRFLLVDDDILLPDNLVRNDLDWREVGTHKVESLARRMQLVNPGVETQVWRAQIGGQEPSNSAETLLSAISKCDLVIDASANPDILNLVAAVAASAKKPVMWAEVFGGGIGGLIARCRPGLEPAPQYMRRAIENWFGERGAPPIRSMRSYENRRDGVPLVADDAEVTVIASHAARLAMDTLIVRVPPLFPFSVYAIGLGAGSVFTQPFDTYPIKVGPALAEIPVEELSKDEAAAEVAKIIQLVEARANEVASASDDSQPTET